MPRPRKATIDPFSDLQKKAAILELEMARQRDAMERLKQPLTREMRAMQPFRGKLDQRATR